jgi:hypothetical protein
MRKAPSRARGSNPSAASLRAMPEIDFSRMTVRRNPFARRIAREGIEIAHDRPSASSLVDMPEADFTSARARRNPYASRAAEAVARMQSGKGRPQRGSEVGPTPTRSIRLPDAVWRALEEHARRRGTTVHALLRDAVARYVASQLGDGS